MRASKEMPTFDELFESLTLIQTGRTPPIPLVMLAPSGDRFWPDWLQDIQRDLASRALISPEDTSLLKQASSAAEAMEHICHFYRVFHAAQYAEDCLELLLHGQLSGPQVQQLNHDYAGLVQEGSIGQGESCDSRGILRPCLRFQLDRRRIGLRHRLTFAHHGTGTRGLAGHVVQVFHTDGQTCQRTQRLAVLPLLIDCPGLAQCLRFIQSGEDVLGGRLSRCVKHALQILQRTGPWSVKNR